MRKDKQLSNKNLDDANLSGSDLSDADLSQASLRRSRLTGAKLERANLAESDLHGAHLAHVDVTGADLRNADLTDARLHGVDLGQAASTDGVRLAGAKGVTGELAELASRPAEQVHLERVLERIADLHRECAEAVHALFGSGGTVDEDGKAPTDADRRVAMERIGAIRRRQDALENELLTTIEAGMALHPGSTVDDR